MVTMPEMELDVMAQVQEQKAAEMSETDLDQLTPEVAEMARKTRKTFDLPTNAVKVDPLR